MQKRRKRTRKKRRETRMNKKENASLIKFAKKNIHYDKKTYHCPVDEHGNTYDVLFNRSLNLEKCERMIDFMFALGVTVKENGYAFIRHERHDVIIFASVIKFYTDISIDELNLSELYDLMENPEFYNFIMHNETVDYEQVYALFDSAMHKMEQFIQSIRPKTAMDNLLDQLAILLNKVGNGILGDNISPDTINNFIQTVSKLKDINDQDLITGVVKAAKDVEYSKPDIH